MRLFSSCAPNNILTITGPLTRCKHKAKILAGFPDSPIQAPGNARSVLGQPCYCATLTTPDVSGTGNVRKLLGHVGLWSSARGRGVSTALLETPGALRSLPVSNGPLPGPASHSLREKRPLPAGWTTGWWRERSAGWGRPHASFGPTGQSASTSLRPPRRRRPPGQPPSRCE